MTPRQRLLALSLGVVIASSPRSAPAATDTAASAPAAARQFTLSKLNRTYKDLVSDFAPIQQSGMTLTLSSPSQTVQVKDNSATLAARPDGTYDATITLEFLGKGLLTGDIEWAGQGTRLQDELIVPQQRITLPGRVRVKPAATGYELTTLTLPAELELVVKSQMAGNFVTWCERLALVPFTNLDCTGLERSMSAVKVPLPAAGETYLLPYEELGEEERRAIDEYLGVPASGSPSDKK